MIDRRIPLSVAALILAAPSLPASFAAEAAPARSPRGGLCQAGETILFQCRTGSRTIAVCGSRSPPRAVYRFGRPGRTEFTSAAGTRFSWARTGYIGGGELHIRFRSGAYDYAVYSRVVRTGFGTDGLHYPRFEAGVMVARGNRLLADRRCADEDRYDGQVEDYMPEGQFLEWWDLQDRSAH